MFRNFLFKLLVSKFYRIYMSTTFKYQPLELHKEGKYLCLAPHADDESISMGGTLIKYGPQFDVICMTDGSRCGLKDTMSKEDVIKIRTAEFKEAMSYAGVNSFKYLEQIPDKKLVLNLEELEKIDIFQYDIIFLPSLSDAHRDHKAVSLLLKELLRTKKHKKDLKIAFYEVWSTLPFVNYYVDISDIAGKKRELINFYKSQLIDFDYTEKTLALNSYRGLIPNIDYAEAFCILDKKDFLEMCRLP